MASQEMETLKTGMKMMMEKGFAPKFDGKMDPLNLREVVFAAAKTHAGRTRHRVPSGYLRWSDRRDQSTGAKER